MITCKFCHKLTAQDWGKPCPYCRIKALEEQLAEAEDALRFYATNFSWTMRAKKYFEALQDNAKK